MAKQLTSTGIERKYEDLEQNNFEYYSKIIDSV